jgi:alanine dehydrogenase
MSAIAGNMAAAIGNYYLAKVHGGKGTQLGMVLGERHGKVLVIGTGVVGQHAARTADGLGAAVYVFGRSERKYQQWRDTLSPQARFVPSNPDIITGHIRDADLVIGAVLVPGARAPHVISEAMVRAMEPGSVIVDVSIDQGGCIATARPTSLSDPVYVRHGVLHYCVSNMPGAYPRTSTITLTGATLPYILRLADRGLAALRDDPGFAKGINIHQGYVTCRPVADALRLESRYKPFAEAA